MGTASTRARAGVPIAALLLCASAQAQETPVKFTGWYGFEGYQPGSTRGGLMGEPEPDRSRAPTPPAIPAQAIAK